MAFYCTYCGTVLEDGTKFCPECGADLSGTNPASGTNNNSGWSDAAKTAAAVGGAIVGASALNNLARRVTHRRRPPYIPPEEPRPRRGGRPHGMGGPGGDMGGRPGNRRPR